VLRALPIEGHKRKRTVEQHELRSFSAGIAVTGQQLELDVRHALKNPVDCVEARKSF
jgi:hypothetical protein